MRLKIVVHAKNQARLMRCLGNLSQGFFLPRIDYMKHRLRNLPNSQVGFSRLVEFPIKRLSFHSVLLLPPPLPPPASATPQAPQPAPRPQTPAPTARAPASPPLPASSAPTHPPSARSAATHATAAPAHTRRPAWKTEF